MTKFERQMEGIIKQAVAGIMVVYHKALKKELTRQEKTDLAGEAISALSETLVLPPDMEQRLLERMQASQTTPSAPTKPSKERKAPKLKRTWPRPNFSPKQRVRDRATLELWLAGPQGTNRILAENEAGRIMGIKPRGGWREKLDPLYADINKDEWKLRILLAQRDPNVFRALLYKFARVAKLKPNELLDRFKKNRIWKEATWAAANPPTPKKP